jgi:hypothetical protein
MVADCPTYALDGSVKFQFIFDNRREMLPQQLPR